MYKSRSGQVKMFFSILIQNLFSRAHKGKEESIQGAPRKVRYVTSNRDMRIKIINCQRSLDNFHVPIEKHS